MDTDEKKWQRCGGLTVQRLISWTIGCLGAAATIYCLMQSIRQPTVLLFFTLFSLGFSLYPVQLRYSITMSLNLTLLIYCVLVYGPEIATVSVAVQALVNEPSRTFTRTVYDFGQLTLSTFISGLYWERSGLSTTIDHVLLMGVIVSVVMYALNSSAVAFAVHIFNRKSFYSVWRSILQDSAASYFMMEGIGVILAALYYQDVKYIIWASSPFLLIISILLHRHGKNLNQLRKQYAKELEMLQREQMLMETNRLVMEHIPNAVIVIDRDGILKLANPAAVQFFQWNDRPFIGKPIEQLFKNLQLFTDEPIFILETLRTGKEFLAQPKTFYREGVLLQLLVTTAVIRDSQGNPSGVIGLYTDVTKQKQMEEKYQLSEQLSALGQVAAGIAHEIRNPLTVSRGFIDLILRTHEPMGWDKLRMYLEMVSKEMNRMASLITDFLNLSKPHQTIKRKELLPSELIQQVLDFMSGEANLYNIQCQMVVYSERSIVADENQLKQVFINLVRNAIEAMPGGGKLEITIEKDVHAPMISITVTDSGVGIEPQKLTKIFSPFFTTKDTGTGLGLSTVYQIITHHGGTIHVESRVGEGTRFTICLPSNESAPDERSLEKTLS
jgi:PAS domain S-box-containing protein